MLKTGPELRMAALSQREHMKYPQQRAQQSRALLRCAHDVEIYHPSGIPSTAITLVEFCQQPQARGYSMDILRAHMII